MVDKQHVDRDPIVEFSQHRMGNYRLVRPLGDGGFATVYLGEHLYLKRFAAIKVLRTVLAEQEKTHFLEEARLLANLSHPHIVRVLEFAVAQRWTMLQNIRMEEHIPFLVMDYAPGGSLRALYPRSTRLPLVKVINILKQVAAALQYAHDRKIIHRDIKPENLLVNERREVMLSDFGLALLAPSPDLISLQGMAGTLLYAAPEQLQGKPTFASDQYSLGILAYEWLCGSLPFGGEDAEIIMQHISSSPPRLRNKNPAIQRTVEEVVLRSLAKDPRQRYPSVQAFVQALEEAGRAHESRLTTGRLVAVGSPASPPKREFPAFHYFSQKATVAPSDQQVPRPVHVLPRENGHAAAISPSMQRNRLRMLQKVRAFWVKGVLERSLHGAPFLMPSLDERQDVVASAWSPGMGQGEKPGRSLAPGTAITEVYDQAGGELLILGEAGIGKTTLLLELARTLLDRAAQDEAAPIPVVFVLSSWSEQQMPVEQWLIEELHSKYQVPRPLGAMWLHNEMLVPLLDGLDEVAEDTRSACVSAINAYKKTHGLSSLVVCSRLTEYLLFPPRVLLQRAVVVQPLTMPQVKEYFEKAGKAFESVYQLLLLDPVLQRLVTTPFMLHIITVMYRNTSPQGLLTAIHSSKERYQMIFNTYVEQMLHRRPAPSAEAPQQLVNTLTHLAWQMQQHGQRVFYTEQMQPDWIEKNRWKQFYKWLAVILPGALIGGLAGILSNVLLFHAGSIGSVVMDAVYGVVIGFLLSNRPTDDFSSEKQRTAAGSPEQLWLKKEHFIAVVLVGLITFLCIGSAKGSPAGLANGIFLGVLSFPLSILFGWCNKTGPDSGSHTGNRGESSVIKHLRNGIAVGIVCGLTSVITILVTPNGPGNSFLFLLTLGIRDSLRNALLGTLLSALLANNNGIIHRAEIVSWSWKAFCHSIRGPRNIVYDLLIGIAVGIVFASKQVFQGNISSVVSAGLSTGLLVALGIRLVYALLRSISSKDLDDHYRSRPNEGVRRSLFHGLVGGVIGIFAATLLSIITTVIATVSSNGLSSLQQSSTLLNSLTPGLADALLLAPVGGLLVWLLLGGLAFYQYGTLRFVLWRTGVVPQHISPLLDYAVDCVFLYRVGGGYIFIHRLLHEYFASLANQQTHALAEHEPLVRRL